MSVRNQRRALGILTLADPHGGSSPPPAHLFNDADWFAYPTVRRTVPNAWAREVVGGNLSLAQAYADAARDLEKQGVAAITANCGYAIAYQGAVRNAVSIPVACSSLMLLPFIATMLPKTGCIGLLCFDADRLSAQHLQWAGVSDRVPLAIGGIEGTGSWRNWLAPVTKTEFDTLETDVMTAARKLLRDNPRISHWLLECAGFPRLRPLIKSETGRPVFDWVSLCNLLMESAPPLYLDE